MKDDFTDFFFFHRRVVLPQPFSIKEESSFLVKDPQIVDSHIVDSFCTFTLPMNNNYNCN